MTAKSPLKATMSIKTFVIQPSREFVQCKSSEQKYFANAWPRFAHVLPVEIVEIAFTWAGGCGLCH